MKTRRILFVLFILLIALLSTLIVSAHPGRTDANGGHYDKEAGEYHYHHGYPAHYHTNGRCPYDYDDKINHHSGGSSRSSDSSSSIEESSDIFGFIMTAFGIGIFVFIIAGVVCDKMKTDESRKTWAFIFFIIWIVLSLVIGFRDYL